MAPLCTICYDDTAEVQFECTTPDCDYQLCGECLEEAFKDFSGANNKSCQLCQRPSAIGMAEARIGKGGVKAVQRELRETVELEVRLERGLLEEDRKDASQINEEALQLFHSVSETLNLKCPRCELAFFDYNGCNALYCANEECSARFCAICLKDCGADAHPHVRQEHGNLFDKALFERTTKQRNARTIEDFLAQLEGSGKPFELIQLVRNHLERAGQIGGGATDRSSSKPARFIQQATRELEAVIASDRLSILNETIGRHGIAASDLSPRAAIVPEIRIWLQQERDEFELTVEAQIEGRWITADSAENVKEWIRNGLIAASGPLATLDQSMRCAVIAIEGERSLYQVRQKGNDPGSTKKKLRFFKVDRYGEADDHDNGFPYYERRRVRVLALNPNDRYLRLLRHVQENVSADTLPVPLQHFVGKGEPEPVCFELEVTVPETMLALNDDQRKAGHPLCLKTAGEVAGPPGTGKTKTISELVRALLRCTSKNIVVLSERNGAIDAIAEKFASLCTKTTRKTTKVTDLSMWMKIMTFGSLEAMGKHAKLFLIDTKVNFHPEVIEAIRVEGCHRDACLKHARGLRQKLVDQIKLFGDSFDDDLARNQATSISRRLKEYSASRILGVVTTAKDEICTLLQDGVTETAVEELVERNGDLLQSLLPFHFNKQETGTRLRDIVGRLTELLKSTEYDEAYIQDLDDRYKNSQQAKQAVEARVKQTLALAPRLRMSTIGSSHRLFTPTEEADEDITDRLAGLDIVQQKIDDSEGAVIIFDESGCIPSYELLGLNRLDCPIAAILTVGDKKQLPPYNPTSNNGRSSNGRQQQIANSGLKSLLDVSEVKDKIALRTQYRVPKDIAAILNARVYNGQYKTHQRAVVECGLEFLHVDKSQRKEFRKYVNSDEVDVVLRLASQYVQDGLSVMILTPYKNQQREIQFQMKRRDAGGLEDSCVLTVDQCQGQEADVVLFTLVQKPTRFLNKNRLNVAMSRTKNKLIIVADRHEFRKASENTGWDCSLIAKDILKETVVGVI